MQFFSYIFFTFLFVFSHAVLAKEIGDAQGRSLDIPDTVKKVICSGSGCLRLLTYLQAQDIIVAVDDIEGRRRQFDARPYALANPGFKELQIFGEFRGKDNPELILTLREQPEVILKAVATTQGTAGLEPEKLQQKTGIPAPTGQVTAEMIESVYGLAVEIHHINRYPVVVPLEAVAGISN